ncbi:MAG: CoA transferase, partial [Alphaproteobacteria bacterium]|nr:CoA transferase [Alphaproteobacteria bacterium]
DDLLSRLEAAGVPAGPINTVADVFDDAQVQARGMKVDLENEDALLGSVPSVRTPIVINGEPMVAERASPRLGADTDDVLNDKAWGG